MGGYGKRGRSSEENSLPYGYAVYEIMAWKNLLGNSVLHKSKKCLAYEELPNVFGISWGRYHLQVLE
jgi:hypothetical protein